MNIHILTEKGTYGHTTMHCLEPETGCSMDDVVKWCLESAEGPAAVARARGLAAKPAKLLSLVIVRDETTSTKPCDCSGHYFGACGLDGLDGLDESCDQQRVCGT